MHLPLLMVLAGTGLCAYRFVTRVKVGDHVVVAIEDLRSDLPAGSPLAIKIPGLDILVEVTNADGAVLRGAVLGRVDGVALPDSRVKMPVSFARTAIKRKA